MLMTTPAGYQGEASPNRMDALVWAISDLKLATTSTVAMFLKSRNR